MKEVKKRKLISLVDILRLTVLAIFPATLYISYFQ